MIAQTAVPLWDDLLWILRDAYDMQGAIDPESGDANRETIVQTAERVRVLFEFIASMQEGKKVELQKFVP